MSGRGLPPGDFDYELRGDDTEEAEAIIDLAWPSGLPEGRGATCRTSLGRICGNIPNCQPSRIRLPHERRGVQAARGQRNRRGRCRRGRVTGDSPVEPHLFVSGHRYPMSIRSPMSSSEPSSNRRDSRFSRRGHGSRRKRRRSASRPARPANSVQRRTGRFQFPQLGGHPLGHLGGCRNTRCRGRSAMKCPWATCTSPIVLVGYFTFYVGWEE